MNIFKRIFREKRIQGIPIFRGPECPELQEKISKVANYRIGARITDVNELVQLSEDRQPVFVTLVDRVELCPARSITHWPLSLIVKTELYHAVIIDNL